MPAYLALPLPRIFLWMGLIRCDCPARLFERIVNHIDLRYNAGNFHYSMEQVRDGRMPDTPKQEIKLFYCYAREDKAMRDELEKYLSSLKRLYSLRNWHDREILPGQEWEQAIETSLNTAHLILLLISPDFMNSEYCYGKEMQRALERHEEGTCKVIPIILRPTFLDAAPFNKLQMLPTDAKPITRWTDRDEAFHDVVKEINLVLKDLLLSLKSKKDWLDEGISFRNLKRYDYALEAFEQALRLDPNYLEAYQEKGMALLELERYDYALEAFEQALHLKPNHVGLYVVKGQTLNALEHYEDALTSFEQAIHLDPNIASAYIGRDRALQQLGISRKAQEELASQLEQTRKQLADYQKRITEMESQLQNASQNLTEQQKQSEQLESLLAQTREQKDEALQQLSLSRKAQEELASQLEKVQQQLAAQQKRTKQLEIDLQEARKPLMARQEDKVSHIAPLEVEKLKVIHTLSGHTADVYGIAISPNGQTLVSASNDKTIKVWGT